MRLNSLLNYYEPASKSLDAEAQQRIMNTLHQQLPINPPRTKLTKSIRYGILAATMIVVLSLSVVAICFSRSTELLKSDWAMTGLADPEIGVEIEMSQAQFDYIESRTVPLSQTVTDGGITITLDSMTCTEHEVNISCTTSMADDCTLPYTPDEILLVPDVPTFYWHNPSYGSVIGQWATMGGAIGQIKLQGWGAVPNDANLCDGQTTLKIVINSVHVLTPTGGYSEELATLSGNWSITVPIPEFEPEVVYTVDTAPIEEAFRLENMDFLVSSSGCHLGVDGSYRTIGREHLDVEDSDGPDAFAVEFYCKDGTKIPVYDSNGIFEDGYTDCYITWVPVDPATIDHVTIFDGKTEVTLPLIPQ